MPMLPIHLLFYRTMNTRPLRIAVLISGSGSNLQAIIDHQTQHSRLYEIVLVISNKAGAYGLQRAEKAGITQQVIRHQDFPDREQFDAQLQQAIDGAEADLVVLAGFMRILSSGFTEHYLGRMLNIHPSLLPDFPGLDTHQRALDAGRTEHGASVHFVTPDMDGGPVVLQARVTVKQDDTTATLAARVLAEEHALFPLAILWFAQGRIRMDDSNRALLDGEPLDAPVDMAGVDKLQC